MASPFFSFFSPWRYGKQIFCSNFYPGCPSSFFLVLAVLSSTWVCPLSDHLFPSSCHGSPGSTTPPLPPFRTRTRRFYGSSSTFPWSPTRFPCPILGVLSSPMYPLTGQPWFLPFSTFLPPLGPPPFVDRQSRIFGKSLPSRPPPLSAETPSSVPPSLNSLHLRLDPFGPGGCSPMPPSLPPLSSTLVNSDPPILSPPWVYWHILPQLFFPLFKR